MSKASKWARTLDRLDYRPRPDLIWRDRPSQEQIQPLGFSDGRVCLGFRGTIALSEREALDLARWILDTFGEESGS